MIDRHIGGFLSKIEDNRLLADYVEDIIPEQKAREAVDMAREFVGAMESRLDLMMANRTDGQVE